jgi:shikimate kinase
MKLMNQSGITVYLMASPELILSRIEATARKRPVFQLMQGSNSLQNIANHLKSREPFYKLAKITVDAANPNISELKISIQDYNTIIPGV